MPRFTYLAKTDPHTTTEGNIEAEGVQDAIAKLTNMGYFPVAVRAENIALEQSGWLSPRRVSKKEVFFFTRQLSTLIDSGVNILNALTIVSGQVTNKNLSSLLNEIISQIKDGKSFSDSLAAFPNLFSGLFISMVRVGEASGGLNVTLKRLADFLEEEEEFKSSLRSSLTYPFFIFAVSMLTVVVLLVFVIPRLVTMFQDMGQVLPLPTAILIAASGFIRANWWMLLAFIGIVVFLLRRIYKSPWGRFAWDRVKLKIIISGAIALKSEIARLARTLSLLLSSGVSISPSLDIAAAVLDNQVFKQEAAKFKEKISQGASLSQVFREARLFPDFVSSIIAIGEETGALDAALLRIAQDYEREVDRSLKSLMRLLEPLIILIMGLIVGFIVLSMLLPIFQINITAR